MITNPDGSTSFQFSAADQALPREEKIARINALFQKYLGRLPDESGLNYYLRNVEGGRALAEVELEISGSLERYMLANNLTPENTKLVGGLPIGYEYLNSNLDERIRDLGKTILKRDLYDAELEFYFRFGQSDGNLTRVESMMKASSFNPLTNAWTPLTVDEKIATPPAPGKTVATVGIGALAALALLFLR